MSRTTLSMTDPLYRYYLRYSLREEAILTLLREETAKLPTANMQIAPEEGQFLAFIIRLLGAQKTLDIGTYTGYSALIVAMSMPKEGQVIACDISTEWTEIARKYWQLADQEQKIDLRLAPALTTLENLIKEGEENTFDFIFIDADKKNYIHYYEYSLKLLRPGGVLAADNVLWSGRVADSADNDEGTLGIREFNRKVHEDPRVFITMLPIADGLTLARKKE
jgi:predicted O-methyltransferase YrrM